MNVMTIDSHHAKLEFDPDLDMFRGEILGLNGGADFYGKPQKSCAQSSSARYRLFLRFAQKKGLNPSVISPVNSICESRRNFTKNWLLRRRQKAKASILWHKRLCRKVLREVREI
jgi:hypothetical protein